MWALGLFMLDYLRRMETRYEIEFWPGRSTVAERTRPWNSKQDFNELEIDWDFRKIGVPPIWWPAPWGLIRISKTILFFQDLASLVSTRRGKFSSPSEAVIVSSLWRDNFNNSDLPPPLVYTLEDRSDFSLEFWQMYLIFRFLQNLNAIRERLSMAEVRPEGALPSPHSPLTTDRSIKLNRRRTPEYRTSKRTQSIFCPCHQIPFAT